MEGFFGVEYVDFVFHSFRDGLCGDAASCEYGFEFSPDSEFGFGFSLVVNDFKIVRYPRSLRAGKVEVYSLSTGVLERHSI